VRRAKRATFRRSHESQLAKLGNLFAKNFRQPLVHHQRGGGTLAAQSGKAETDDAAILHIDELDVRAVRLSNGRIRLRTASMRSRAIMSRSSLLSAALNAGAAGILCGGTLSGFGSLCRSETDPQRELVRCPCKPQVHAGVLGIGTGHPYGLCKGRAGDLVRPRNGTDGIRGRRVRPVAPDHDVAVLRNASSCHGAFLTGRPLMVSQPRPRWSRLYDPHSGCAVRFCTPCSRHAARRAGR